MLVIFQLSDQEHPYVNCQTYHTLAERRLS